MQKKYLIGVVCFFAFVKKTIYIAIGSSFLTLHNEGFGTSIYGTSIYSKHSLEQIERLSVGLMNDNVVKENPYYGYDCSVYQIT